MGSVLYIVCVFEKCRKGIIVYENKENLLSLINNYVNWKDVSISDRELSNIQYLGKVQLIHLEQFDTDSLYYIVQSRFFEINNENLEVISKKILLCNIEELLLKTIQNGSITFKDYFLENLNIVIDKSLVVQRLDENSVKIILNNEKVDYENKIKVIKECDFAIENPNDIKEDLIKEIVNINKLCYKIETIFELYKKYDNNFLSYFYHYYLYP